MMQILVTKEFETHFKKLPKAVQKKAEKQRKLFCENPFHPSLHTEKLIPKKKEIWSFRIDKTYRVIFRFTDGNTVLLLNCGHHHWIYKI